MGESVDSDSESEPKEVWEVTLVWSMWPSALTQTLHTDNLEQFLYFLPNQWELCPPPACRGLCVVLRGSSNLSALLQGGENWDPPEKEQSYRVLKLNFLPTPLPLSLLKHCSVVEDKEASIYKLKTKWSASVIRCNKIFIIYNVTIKLLHICEAEN